MMELSCGIIPFKETADGYQVLLVKHKSGDYWSFPKGHVEEGEEHLDTAVRELKEETGLEVDEILTENTLEEQYAFIRDGKNVNKRVIYFLAKVSGAIEVQAPDVVDVKWYRLSEAAQVITFEDSRQVLAHACEIL